MRLRRRHGRRRIVLARAPYGPGKPGRHGACTADQAGGILDFAIEGPCLHQAAQLHALHLAGTRARQALGRHGNEMVHGQSQVLAQAHAQGAHERTAQLRLASARRVKEQHQLVGGRAGRAHADGSQPLAVQAGHARSDLLDLGAVEIGTVDDDHFLDAAHDVQLARTQEPHVAGLEPAIAQRLGREVGPAVIAREHRGPAEFDPPDLTLHQGAACIVHDALCTACDRVAQAGHRLAGRCPAAQRERRDRLGHAKGHPDGALPEPVLRKAALEIHEDRLRHRLPGVDEHAQTGQVPMAGGLAAGCTQQQVECKVGRPHRCDPVLGHEVQPARGSLENGGRIHLDLVQAQHRRHHAQEHHAAHMVQRHPVQRGLAGHEAQLLLHAADHGGQIAAAQYHALGRAGAARSQQHQCGLPRPGAGRGLRGRTRLQCLGIEQLHALQRCGMGPQAGQGCRRADHGRPARHLPAVEQPLQAGPPGRRRSQCQRRRHQAAEHTAPEHGQQVTTVPGIHDDGVTRLQPQGQQPAQGAAGLVEQLRIAGAGLGKIGSHMDDARSGTRSRAHQRLLQRISDTRVRQRR